MVLLMIMPDTLVRLFIVVSVISIEMVKVPIAALDPTIRTFIGVVVVLGPICIGLLILVLKKIEKNDPHRIRWR